MASHQFGYPLTTQQYIALLRREGFIVDPVTGITTSIHPTSQPRIDPRMIDEALQQLASENPSLGSIPPELLPTGDITTGQPTGIPVEPTLQPAGFGDLGSPPDMPYVAGAPPTGFGDLVAPQEQPFIPGAPPYGFGDLTQPPQQPFIAGEPPVGFGDLSTPPSMPDNVVPVPSGFGDLSQPPDQPFVAGEPPLGFGDLVQPSDQPPVPGQAPAGFGDLVAPSDFQPVPSQSPPGGGTAGGAGATGGIAGGAGAGSLGGGFYGGIWSPTGMPSYSAQIGEGHAMNAALAMGLATGTPVSGGETWAGSIQRPIAVAEGGDPAAGFFDSGRGAKLAAQMGTTQDALAAQYDATTAARMAALPKQYLSGYNWFARSPSSGGFAQPGPRQGTQAAADYASSQLGQHGYWTPRYSTDPSLQITPPTTPGWQYDPNFSFGSTPAPTTPEAPPVGLQHGGAIHGLDRGYDSELAMLEPGEVVLNEEEQQHVKQTGKLPPEIAKALYRARMKKAA